MQIAIVLMSVLLLILVHKICKVWFTPASINALMWSCFALASVIFYSSNEYVTFLGVFYLLILAVAAVLGDWLANRVGAAVNACTEKTVFARTKCCYRFDKRLLMRVTVAFIVLGLLRNILFLYANGFSLKNFLSLDAFLEMNHAMAQLRYNGEGEKTSTILQIMLCFIYAAPFCGGWLMPYATRKREYALSLLTLLPIIISLLIINTKAGVIASVILWCSGLLVSSIQKQKADIAIDKKMVKTIAIAAVLFFAVLFASMMARTGRIDGATFLAIVKKFAVYAFGHMEAFDVWFQQVLSGCEELTLDWGANTFMAIYNVFTNGERIQGVYEYITGATSNVFTGYRGLLMDFGLFGAIAAMILVGFIGGTLYRSIRDDKRDYGIKIVALVAIYFWLLYAMIISAWVYYSYIGTFVLIFAFLKAPGVWKAVCKWVSVKLKA